MLSLNQCTSILSKFNACLHPGDYYLPSCYRNISPPSQFVRNRKSKGIFSNKSYRLKNVCTWVSRLKRNREVLQDGKHAQRNKMPTVSLGENNKMYGSLGVMKNSVFSLQGYHLSMFDGCLFLVRRRGWDVRKKLHQWAGLNCAHSKNMYWNQWAKKPIL